MNSIIRQLSNISLEDSDPLFDTTGVKFVIKSLAKKGTTDKDRNGVYLPINPIDVPFFLHATTGYPSFELCGVTWSLLPGESYRDGLIRAYAANGYELKSYFPVRHPGTPKWYSAYFDLDGKLTEEDWHPLVIAHAASLAVSDSDVPVSECIGVPVDTIPELPADVAAGFTVPLEGDVGFHDVSAALYLASAEALGVDVLNPPVADSPGHRARANVRKGQLLSVLLDEGADEVKVTEAYNYYLGGKFHLEAPGYMPMRYVLPYMMNGEFPDRRDSGTISYRGETRDIHDYTDMVKDGLRCIDPIKRHYARLNVGRHAIAMDHEMFKYVTGAIDAPDDPDELVNFFFRRPPKLTPEDTGDYPCSGYRHELVVKFVPNGIFVSCSYCNIAFDLLGQCPFLVNGMPGRADYAPGAATIPVKGCRVAGVFPSRPGRVSFSEYVGVPAVWSRDDLLDHLFECGYGGPFRFCIIREGRDSATIVAIPYDGRLDVEEDVDDDFPVANQFMAAFVAPSVMTNYITCDLVTPYRRDFYRPLIRTPMVTRRCNSEPLYCGAYCSRPGLICNRVCLLVPGNVVVHSPDPEFLEHTVKCHNDHVCEIVRPKRDHSAVPPDAYYDMLVAPPKGIIKDEEPRRFFPAPYK